MQMQKTSLGNRNHGAVKRTNQDLSLSIGMSRSFVQIMVEISPYILYFIKYI